MLPVYQAFDRVKFSEVPTDDARALEDKLERASRTFADRDGWLAPHQRIVVLRELARLVDEQRERFTQLIGSTGADEAAPNLDVVKGLGDALVRERIVAAASRRQVILVGHDKLVDRLGTRGRIPIEVVPFACSLVLRRARGLGLDPVVRLADGRRFITDNGNLTIDCGVATPLADARAARVLEADLRAIPGVVDTGLFLGTAERVLIGHPGGHVDVLEARR